MTEQSLTESQHRFAELLEQVPWLQPYWDVRQNSYQPDRLASAMEAWAHGEQIMARFFVMVWRGQNVLDFDLADAAAVLDQPLRLIISQWFMDPFWP